MTPWGLHDFTANGPVFLDEDGREHILTPNEVWEFMKVLQDSLFEWHRKMRVGVPKLALVGKAAG